MGRGMSASSRIRRLVARGYPTLTGNPTWEEMEEFARDYTAYSLDPSTEGNVDPEFLKLALNRAARMFAEYGDPNDGKKPFITFSAHLENDADAITEYRGKINLSWRFGDATALIDRAKSGLSPNPTDQGWKSWWNIPPNPSRDALLTYAFTHEMSHSYFFAKLDKRYGGTTEKTAFAAWDDVISIAKTKYGLNDGSTANSAYPYYMGREGMKHPKYPTEAFAEALAGYECGQRDPISMAAHDWMIGAV